MKYTIYLRGEGYLENISIDDEDILSMMGMNEGNITIEDENRKVIIDGDFEDFIKNDDTGHGYHIEYNYQKKLYDKYYKKSKKFCVTGTLMYYDFGSFTFETNDEFDINKLKFIKFTSLPFFDDFNGIIESVYYDGKEVDFNDDYEFKAEEFAFEECGGFESIQHYVKLLKSLKV